METRKGKAKESFEERRRGSVVRELEDLIVEAKKLHALAKAVDTCDKAGKLFERKGLAGLMKDSAGRFLMLASSLRMTAPQHFAPDYIHRPLVQAYLCLEELPREKASELAMRFWDIASEATGWPAVKTEPPVPAATA
jgi:hypothetical protein